MFNFSKYTEWPSAAFASAEAPLQLCLFSSDSDVGRALSALANNSSRGRKIKVAEVRRVDELKPCHLVYFEQDLAITPDSVSRGVGTLPLLTIGESGKFAAQGGVIGLVVEGKRLVFEVNLDAAKRADLRLSSQLLALARIVKEP